MTNAMLVLFMTTAVHSVNVSDFNSMAIPPNSTANSSVAATSSTSTTLSTISIVNISIGIIGVFANLFACIVIVLHHPLRKRLHDYLILNQCILDLIIGLALIFYFSLNFRYVTGGPSLYAVCYLFNTRILFTGTFVASAWNIAALAVERYAEIVHPMRHQRWLTKNRVITIIAGVWVFALSVKTAIVYASTLVYNNNCYLGYYPNPVSKLLSTLFNSILEFFMPLCIVACCYAAMARSIRKLRITIGSAHDLTRIRRNIQMIVAVISIAFTLSVGPKQLVILYSGFGIGNVDFTGLTYTVCVSLTYANCCINPFIYMFMHDEFKKGLRGLVFGKKLIDDTAVTGFSMSAVTDNNGCSTQISLHLPTDGKFNSSKY